MSESIIGKVGVDVYPDTSKFRAALKGQLESIEKGLGDILVEIEADTKGLISETKAAVEAAEKAAGDIEVDVKVDDDALRQAALKSVRDVDKELAKVEFHPKMSEMAAGQIRRDLEDLMLKRESLKVKVDAEFDVLAKRRLQRDLGDVEKSIHDIEGATKDLNLELRRQHSIFGNSVKRARQLSSAMDGFSDGVGRAFGRGSRNNFLNFLGGRMASVAVALSAPIVAVSSLGKAVGDAVDKFRTLTAEGVSTGAALVRSLGTGLSGAVSGLLSLAAALTVGIAAFSALTVLVPVVTMLAGAIIALAGSITIGLMAALLPIIPIITAFGLGLGAAAAAIVPLIDDIKKGKGEFAGAKREIDGLKKSVNDLGRQAAPALGRLAETFSKGANTLVKSFGPAVTRVFSDLDRKLRSPSMDKFYDQWATKMPRIFENFGKGLNSLGTALVAFFAPVLGYAEDLSASFKKTMDRFSAWARSASGQNSIADFLEKARDRGAKLWDIIKNLSKGIWNMMSIGDERAGNDILSYLDRVIEKFKEWTKESKSLSDFKGVDAGTAKAAGIPGVDRNQQSSLETFMDDVKEFSKELKNAAVEVGNFFREMNKPENRQRVNEIAESIAHFAGALDKLSSVMNFVANSSLWGILAMDWSSIKLPDFSVLISGLAAIPGAIQQVLGQGISKIIDGLSSGLVVGLLTIPLRVVAAMTSIAMAIVNTLANALGIHSPSTVMIALMADVGAGIVQGLLAIVGLIAAPVLAIVTAIVNAFKGLPEKVKGAIQGLGNTITTVLGTAKNAATSGMTTLVNGAVGIAKGMPGKVGMSLSPIETFVRTKVSAAKGAAVAGMSAMATEGARAAGAMPGRVQGAISGLPGSVTGVVNNAWSSATSATSSGVGRVAGAAQALTGAVVSATSGLASRMAGVGADIVSGLTAGIMANAGRAAAAAAQMASNALAAAKAAIASHSPSRKFMQLGRDSSTGYAIGVTQKAKQAAAAGARLVTRSLGSAKKKAKTSYKDMYKAGAIIAKGFEVGLITQSARVKDALKSFGKEIKKLTSPQARSVASAIQKNMTRQMREWDSLNAKYKQWVQHAKDLRAAKAEFAEGMVSNALEIAGLSNIEGGFNEVIHRLTVAKDMTTEFAKHLATLRKNGLRKDLYEQIAALGPEAGLSAAKAIAEAGKNGVKQVNSLQADLLKVSSKMGDDSASHLYDSGIKMATSIANGFRKQMKEVEKSMARQARRLAQIINDQLRAQGLESRVKVGTSATSKKGYMAPIGSGTQNVLNYYAAPGTSMSEQQQLFKAFKKAGF